MLDELAAVAPFRREVREWARAHVPPDWRAHQRGAGHHELVSFLRWWAGELRSAGWLVPHWPREWGGGLSVVEQVVLAEELARGDAPGNALYQVALYNAAPAIIHNGTDAQRRRYLPGMLEGEVWCQGFSEPNAGSDLASLQTRAVADGDDFLISGQKIWQSAAHHADFSLLGARTDPEAPKHRGISLFVVPMDSPGVIVRPIIDLRGSHYFNEVFFENVRVPRTNVVGELNRGWYAMTTTLDFERSNVGQSAQMRRNWEDVAAFVKEAPPRCTGESERQRLRIELAERRLEIELARLIAYQVVSMQAHGLVPNHEASMSKLFASELTQRLAGTFMRILGLYGALDHGSRLAALDGFMTCLFLESPANTIRAGTSEIQRNIIATRGLGLPRG